MTTIIENHQNRVVVGEINPLAYFEAIAFYAKTVQNHVLLPESVVSIRRALQDNLSARGTTITLPEKEHPERYYGLDFRINPDDLTCEYMFHTSSSAELDLLARTSDYIATFIGQS